MGFSTLRSPDRAILIAVASVPMASSCPKTTIFRSRSRLRSTWRSDRETVLGGIRAILATISSTSGTPMVFFRRDAGSRR